MALGLSFAFDANKETPDDVKRRRALADAIMGRRAAPQNVGQGWGAIADGIVANVQRRRANAAQQAGQESASAAFDPIIDAFRAKMTGGFPAAPNPGNSSSMATMPATDYASARVAQAHGGGSFNGDLRSGIIATAEAIGADPVDLATAISYETAGTFDPTKKGPRTQWGQHRGLIQFGEPQAKQHGVDWDDPIGSQLGPDGAIASYFKSSGFQPGMSGLDLYSTINAGAPGRYNRSDANNGGAPGTVQDKWEKQMAGHREKAMQLIGDYSPAHAQAPQTESDMTPEMLQQWAFANYVPDAQNGAVDAVNALGTAQPVGVAETEADILAQEQAMMGQDPLAFQQPDMMMPSQGTQPRLQAPMAPAQQPMPQPMPQAAPPLTDPRMVDDMPVAGIQPQQLAQAGDFPEMAGNNPQAIPAPGPDIGMLLQAASNPWLSEQQRGIVNMMLEQQMQAQDPRYGMQLEADKLGLEKLRLEIEAMRNPQPGHRVLSPQEAQSYGLTPDKTYQISKDGKISQVGGSMVEVNMGGNSSKFVEESDRAAAARMNDYVVQGAQAGQMMSDMQQLLDLGAIIGTGREAEFKAAIGPYAQMLGIDVAGLGEAQAFKSITDRLAPQMRPVGAGSSSDRDVAQYLNSLPNLRNSPQGNEIIGNTMRGLAQNKMQAAEIAAAAQMGEITWQEAEKQIRALPNPYENFKKFMKEAGKGDKPLADMSDDELRAIVNGQ